MYRWMYAQAFRFMDRCGEVDVTALVEAWDRECASGGDTLDPNHPAWDIAIDASDDYLKTLKRVVRG